MKTFRYILAGIAGFLVCLILVVIIAVTTDYSANPNYPVSGPIPQIYTLSTKTTHYAGYTGEQLNLILKGTPLAGMGEDVAYLCYLNDRNEMFVVNHMGLESGWGRSPIARIKKNLFGFHAFDRDPFGFAYIYPTWSASLAEYCWYTRLNYDDPSGPYYHGGTIAGMNVHYATDKEWGAKLVSMMNQAHVVVGAPEWVIGYSEQEYRAFLDAWRESAPSWNATLTIDRVVTDLYRCSLEHGGTVYESARAWANDTGVYTSNNWGASSPRAYTLTLMKKAWASKYKTPMPKFYTSEQGLDTIGAYWARLFLSYREAY